MNTTPQQTTETTVVLPGANSATPTEDDLITIAGGVDLEVTHTDGSKEQVKVRQIPVSKITTFAIAIGWGNLADAIALYCDKPKEWVDTLAAQSAVAIAEKGRELNLPFFAAWSKDQAKWKEAITKDRISELEKELAAAKAELASLKSAPASLTTTNSRPDK